MNANERRCLWCGGTPATVEGMTFERQDRNCPCNFCKTLLNKRQHALSPLSASPVYVHVRRRPHHTPRPPKGSE